MEVISKMSTDRAAINLMVDEDVRLVLEFMQEEISATRLIGVAKALPQMAMLLWGHRQQELVITLSLVPEKPKPQSPLLPNATESDLGKPHVGDDSVEAKASQ
jgi:hypothetical protein